VDIAAQLGHNPTVCLDTYAHVMAEQRGATPISAEEQIMRARRSPVSEPSVELTVASELTSAQDLVPASSTSRVGPDRISIFPTVRGGYGVDLTYLGANRHSDAQAASNCSVRRG